MHSSGPLCTFVLDGRLFGIDADAVIEVTRPLPLTPLPLAPPALRGLVNLRGQILPAVDLRACLGRPAGDGGRSAVIVIRSADGEVGLLVDEVCDVIEPDPRTFEPAPVAVGEAAGDLLRGVYKLPHGLLVVLDAHAALQRACRSGSETTVGASAAPPSRSDES